MLVKFHILRLLVTLFVYLIACYEIFNASLILTLKMRVVTHLVLWFTPFSGVVTPRSFTDCSKLFLHLF